jgi:hypothetical protein
VVLVETHLLLLVAVALPDTLPTPAVWDHRCVPDLLQRAPTAPIAALGLVAGFGVAAASGSRPLGGVVLALCGVCCIAIWLRRDGRRTAGWLTLAGLVAFALSHLLGLVIGAWPAVAIVSLATAGLCWRFSDSRRPTVARLRPEAEAH